MPIEPAAAVLSAYLRVPEAAAYLRLSKSTVDKMRTAGTGPRYCKTGRIVVYARSDLDAWLVSRARHSTSEHVATAARRPGRPRKGA